MPDTDIPKLPSTTEEIEAIYASGPAAVVGLVQQLLALLASQQQLIEQLTTHIAEFEERRSRNSRNSNQPPSSDGFNRPPRALRQQSGKKRGGQPGHKAQTLRFSDMPDGVVVHRPTECAECGCPLEDVPPTPGATQRRQVVDLPTLRLETTEHHSHLICCPQCAHRNRAPFPSEVTDSVQYGPHIKAVGVYLMSYQLLPYERTAELLTELFGASPSEGTLYNAQQSAAEQLGAVEEAIRDSLQQAQVAHFDETGLYIGGKRQCQCQWLHVASTGQLTLYMVHPKRGEGGTRAMGVLAGFEGVAVHDGYQSFRVYPCPHALCNAHHLRELTALEEQGQVWAAQMKGLLVQIKGAVDAARDAGQRCLPQGSLASFEGRYRKLVWPMAWRVTRPTLHPSSRERGG